MTGFCPICKIVGELEEDCVIAVCKDCWRTYSLVRKEVMEAVACGGCHTWQRRVFNGETPHCADCGENRNAIKN